MGLPRHTRALCACLCAAALCAPAGATQDTVDPSTELRAAARRALGLDGPPTTVQLSGRTMKHGLPARFRWTLAAEGPFLQELQGPFPESRGFDGREAWSLEGRAPAHPLVFLERERLLTCAWLVSGAWTCLDSPFELTALEADVPGTRRLRLRLVDGLLTGTLILEEPSLLPRAFHFDADFGGGLLRLEDWKAEAKPALPGRITLAPAQGSPDRFEVESAGRSWPCTGRCPTCARASRAARAGSASTRAPAS
jgi:hypothetical protein